MKKLLVLLFCLSTVAFGQDLKSVDPQHKSGDRLSYRLEFDGDPQFDHLSLAFYLIGDAPKDQPGLTAWFGSVNHFTKIKAGVYDVDGVIPNNMVEGEYQLQKVNIMIDPASKQYDAADLKVSIRIRNDSKYVFPPLKSVKPN